MDELAELPKHTWTIESLAPTDSAYFAYRLWRKKRVTAIYGVENEAK